MREGRMLEYEIDFVYGRSDRDGPLGHVIRLSTINYFEIGLS